MVSGVAVTTPPATSLALTGYPHMAGTASSLLGLPRFAFAGVAAPLIGTPGSCAAVVARPSPVAARSDDGRAPDGGGLSALGGERDPIPRGLCSRAWSAAAKSGSS
jgi:hypothetical protein